MIGERGKNDSHVDQAFEWAAEWAVLHLLLEMGIGALLRSLMS